MSEENKSVAQLLHLEIIQNYNLDLADKVIHPDCIIHTPVADPRPGRGPESAKEMSRYDKEMFPDGMTFDHYNIIGEGDLVELLSATAPAPVRGWARIAEDGIAGGAVIVGVSSLVLLAGRPGDSVELRAVHPAPAM